MAQIKIYTTSTCGYCHMLKDYLKEKNIDFEEIDVSQDRNAAEEMQKKSGQLGVPVSEVNGKVIVGFDVDSINKSLGIK